MTAAWPRMPLGEVLRLVLDPQDVSPEQVYPTFGVYGFGRGLFDKPAVSGAEISATKLYRVHARQFVYSRLKAFEGAFGLVPVEFDGRFVTNEFPSFDCVPDRLDPEYLGWYFRSAATWNEAARLSAGVGARRERLHPEEFLSLMIPLPPLAEQRRIVARVEAVAARVTEARQLWEEADAKSLALHRQAADRSYRESASQFSVVPLEEATDCITDGDHFTPQFADTGVKFIFVGNVSTGRLHFDGVKHVSDGYFAGLKPSRKPRRGDVLYSAVGATLGVPAVVNTDAAFCFQRHIALVRPNPDRLVPEYLWHMLRTETLFARAWASITGTAQPTVPLKAIRRYPIPLPPLVEQRRIVAHLDALQAKADALRVLQAEMAAELDALLPAVLARAFAGKL